MNIEIFPQKLDYKASDWRERKKAVSYRSENKQKGDPEWILWPASGFFLFPLTWYLWNDDRNPYDARPPFTQSTLSIHDS